MENNGLTIEDLRDVIYGSNSELGNSMNELFCNAGNLTDDEYNKIQGDVLWGLLKLISEKSGVEREKGYFSYILNAS